MAANKNYGDGATELHQAVLKKNHDRIFELSMQAGFNINVTDDLGFTPLHYAVSEGYFDIASSLVSLKANVNAKTREDGFTPLHIAVLEGNGDIVRMLLGLGADRNAKDCNGRTPIDYVEVHIGGEKIFEAFFSDNMAANKNYGDGATELHQAVLKKKNSQIPKLLEQAGFDINVTDDFGATPLHYAVSAGDLCMALFLISFDADVNAKTREDGVTPLHIAVLEGNMDIVHMLLGEGANRNAKDHNGCTPMDYVEVHVGGDKLFEAFCSDTTFAQENDLALNDMSFLSRAKAGGYREIKALLGVDAKVTGNWAAYVTREENEEEMSR